jgi:hypothetical protein
MQDLRSDVSKAIKEIGCSDKDFGLVNINKWSGIEKRIAARFLRNGVRDMKYRWWWEHLKEPAISVFPYCVPDTILSLVSRSEQVYFIFEDGDKFWIYEGYVPTLRLLINELYHFEYYVVSKKLNWLVCENHHSCLIASGKEIVEKIKNMELA